MSLDDKRSAIRHLLNEQFVADGMAAYFAFYHPDDRTSLVTYPAGAERATGYVALSRTGMDLFRPLLTLRLPPMDMNAGVTLMYEAMPPGTAVILYGPADILPLMQALFDVQTVEHLQLLTLDRSQFEPIINVLVTQETAVNGVPRFAIRQSGEREVAASAGLNWQSPHFAELFVSTSPRNRRQGFGRSVAAAMVNYVLENGRQPLYAVSVTNQASLNLAQSIGFVDSGVRQIILQGTLKPSPL